MKNIIKFFNREQNLLIHIIATIIVTIFGIIFKISLINWVLIYIMVALVITTELINSALELTVDLYTSKFNPKAKIVKDVSAAAVVTAAFTSIIVGLYVFIPYIIKFIKG